VLDRTDVLFGEPFRSVRPLGRDVAAASISGAVTEKKPGDTAAPVGWPPADAWRCPGRQPGPPERRSSLLVTPTTPESPTSGGTAIGRGEPSDRTPHGSGHLRDHPRLTTFRHSPEHRSWVVHRMWTLLWIKGVREDGARGSRR
jgi:hypothetical protein